jgi:hypothetical protein
VVNLAIELQSPMLPLLDPPRLPSNTVVAGSAEAAARAR